MNPMVAAMGHPTAKRMFYWAPVLFGATGRFPSVGDNTVSVAAICAVQLLDAVQICQAMTIENDVLRSLDSLHAPRWSMRGTSGQTTSTLRPEPPASGLGRTTRRPRVCRPVNPQIHRPIGNVMDTEIGRRRRLRTCRRRRRVQASLQP